MFLNEVLIDDLRVLKFGTLMPWNDGRINYINITNFNYTNSTMSLFDLQTVISNGLIQGRAMVQREIFVCFLNILIEKIALKEKLRMLTTQDIQHRLLKLFLLDSIIRNNTLAQGYMFEFKHNFQLTCIERTLIIENRGYLIEMVPSNS